MKRQQKITLGEMRANGIRGLLVYCADYKCAHLKKLWPDEVIWDDSVRLSDLERRFVCQKCGHRGADIRPNFPPARMGTNAR